VLCPIVIFYAFGYIFTPKVEEKFVKTGLIHIETLPSSASVSIAQKRLLEKTPATIRNLLAGQYDVRIFLNGYRPWKRKVTVEPGKAVNAENILLIPQKLKPDLDRTAFRRSLAYSGDPLLLLKGSELAGGLKVFDWKNEKFRSVLPEGSPLHPPSLRRFLCLKRALLFWFRYKDPEDIFFWGANLIRKNRR
jgi:hypothetical protein